MFEIPRFATNDIALQMTDYLYVEEISHSLRSFDMTGKSGI